jgi:prevent-host-death family protein
MSAGVSHGAMRGTMKGTMRLKEDIQPVTTLKASPAKLLRRVSETRRPIVITQSGQPKGVLIDFETYEQLKEATLLLKVIAQGEADIRAGRTLSQDEVFAAARARLSAR